MLIITLCQDQAFHSDVQEVWFYLLQVGSVSILSLLPCGRNQNSEPMPFLLGRVDIPGDEALGLRWLALGVRPS